MSSDVNVDVAPVVPLCSRSLLIHIFWEERLCMFQQRRGNVSLGLLGSRDSLVFI